MSEIRGKRTADGLRVVVVVARFNEVLTGQLLEGACKALQGGGILQDDLTVIHVPGSDEIPLAADVAIRELKPDAVLGLGCVITGETEHARIILEQSSRSLAVLARRHGIVFAGNRNLLVQWAFEFSIHMACKGRRGFRQ